MILPSDCRLLFIGDSITDCGRARPVGESSEANGLGNGYVSLVNALLTAAYPKKHIRVMNTGISGNTVRDLRNRWRTDVISLRPDWVTIMIGINDVWRQFDGLWQPEQFISITEFRATLEHLVETIRPDLNGLVLMSPYYLQTDGSDAMRQTMDSYRAVVADLAQTHSAVFVDTQVAFDHILVHVPAVHLSGDRIHMGTVGHMILAQAFLKEIGYEWSRESTNSV